MPFGHPTASTYRLREITLDLPVAVDFAADSSQAKPSLYLIGSIVEGEPLSSHPTVMPSEVFYTPGGKRVVYHFDPAIGEGDYRVVVHESRFRTTSGENLELVVDDGEQWTGWDLTVVEEDPEPPIGPAKPGDGGSNFRALNTFEVRLDDEAIVSGSSELSGARLEIITPSAVDVRLEIEPLMRGDDVTLYEENLSRDVSTPSGPGGDHITTFESSGPVGSYVWAVFDGSRTEGTIPKDKDGRLALGTALMAAPDVNDIAQFDLPINRRISLYIDGTRVWWGQTRLVPLLVSAERYAIMERGSGTHTMAPHEIADLRLMLWRASYEALRLWKCALPARVAQSMEEYVLTRLAYGWPREDGIMGKNFVRLGDQAWLGQTDGSLLKRLKELASALEACQLEVDLFPEDTLPAGHARLASEARPDFHPERRPYRSTIPLSGGSARLEDIYRRDDPDPFRRRR